MSEINVNPQEVINDLLRQITELTAQNSVLRAALNAAQAENAPQVDDSPTAADSE